MGTTSSCRSRRPRLRSPGLGSRAEVRCLCRAEEGHRARISHVRADPRAARRPGHRLVPALAATVLAVSPV